MVLIMASLGRWVTVVLIVASVVTVVLPVPPLVPGGGDGDGVAQPRVCHQQPRAELVDLVPEHVRGRGRGRGWGRGGGGGSSPQPVAELLLVLCSAARVVLVISGGVAAALARGWQGALGACSQGWVFSQIDRQIKAQGVVQNWGKRLCP